MLKHGRYLFLIQVIIGFNSLLAMNEYQAGQAFFYFDQLPNELKIKILSTYLEDIVKTSSTLFEAHGKLMGSGLLKNLGFINKELRLFRGDLKKGFVGMLKEKFGNRFRMGDIETNNRALKELLNYKDEKKAFEVQVKAGEAILAGIDLGLKMDTGLVNPVLTQAILLGYEKVAKLLIECGDDVNAVNARGDTPLVVAVTNNYPEIVELLLKYNADPNKSNLDGQTVLMWAAFYNRPELVKVLIEHGADTSIKDSDGTTALKIAKRNGYTEIVRLLKSKKCIVC